VAVSDVQEAEAQQELTTYGYFSWRYEKVFNEPGWDGSRIVEESPPGEYSLPFFNVMMQHQVGPRFRTFVNLAGAGGELEVRNIWGEWSHSRFLNIRVGKIYRKFGLYNEILDAVPSYYGIEPPEAFDKDHYLISRTTAVMVLGNISAGSGTLNYAFTTDNGEGSDIFENTFPLGYDVNYKFGTGRYTVGLSGYTSGGKTNSDVGVGEGPPSGGVLPWMAEDEFTLVNVYAEAKVRGFTGQFEYARGSHDAVRDPDAVLEVVNSTSLNDAQLARFLVNPAGSTTDVSNVNTDGDYTVQTWYFRGGYSIDTSKGEIAPYLQWDWYKNPETIAKKTYGGDNEAGVADDGVFNKGTIGIIYRPIPLVAVKLDASSHYYRFHGEDVSFPEIRFDVSYTFGF
jgi:hypothetical protein